MLEEFSHSGDTSCLTKQLDYLSPPLMKKTLRLSKLMEDCGIDLGKDENELETEEKTIVEYLKELLSRERKAFIGKIPH